MDDTHIPLRNIRKTFHSQHISTAVMVQRHEQVSPWFSPRTCLRLVSSAMLMSCSVKCCGMMINQDFLNNDNSNSSTWCVVFYPVSSFFWLWFLFLVPWQFLSWNRCYCQTLQHAISPPGVDSQQSTSSRSMAKSVSSRDSDQDSALAPSALLCTARLHRWAWLERCSSGSVYPTVGVSVSVRLSRRCHHSHQPVEKLQLVWGVQIDQEFIQVFTRRSTAFNRFLFPTEMSGTRYTSGKRIN